ncbi:MAG: hypothetical protein K2J48_10155 [Muribaculaceae bacterium]|nr:hypothetical protein [Muribaculaceae bacterium]MDE6793431.1 hypothetical protein [Muribaculaceae bacterium]
MAKPIKETPILSGKDAERFVDLMNTPRPESEEAKSRRNRSYSAIKKMFVK